MTGLRDSNARVFSLSRLEEFCSHEYIFKGKASFAQYYRSDVEIRGSFLWNALYALHTTVVYLHISLMSTEQRLCFLKPRFPYEVNEESRIFQLRLLLLCHRLREIINAC